MIADVESFVTQENPNAGKRHFWVRSILLPALFGALIATALLYVPGAGWRTNDVTTGTHPGYPDLKPRKYDSSPTNTVQFAAAAASGLRNWKVVERDETTGVLRAEVRTAIPFFTDDVTVTVTPTGADGDSSLVTIRSRSRVGEGDLGENARHIRALQAAMDEKLPRLK
ncbi:MAG: DUF1499 domain-containing protein [Akkermansiaceae bacterium]|nr:DUF1499 domain-containing protein [Armatimonadota bacterium]